MCDGSDLFSEYLLNFANLFLDFSSNVFGHPAISQIMICGHFTCNFLEALSCSSSRLRIVDETAP